MMKCLLCGSTLFDRNCCTACGRTSFADVLEERRKRFEARLTEAAVSGAIGGALTGYLGGGAFDLGGIVGKVLWGAGVGAATSIVIVVVYVWIVLKAPGREVWWWMAWMVPALAAICAIVIGYQEILDWLFGWGIAGWAKGWRAVMLGAFLGALLSAGFAYLGLMRQSRKAN